MVFCSICNLGGVILCAVYVAEWGCICRFGDACICFRLFSICFLLAVYAFFIYSICFLLSLYVFSYLISSRNWWPLML